MACRRFYSVSGQLSLRTLTDLLLGDMGISEIVPYPSKGRARGMYYKDEDHVTMFVRPSDTEDARLFTLAHELREVLGAHFRDIHRKLVDVSGEDLETQADAFASTLIFGEEAFRYSMVETGLDPIRLGRMYNKSARTMICRIVRSLAGRSDPVPFWAAIYERRPGIRPGCMYSAGAYRSPKFTRASRGKLPNALFVRRGHLVRIKDNLWRALRYSRSVYIESVYGLDLWNGQPLTAVIRPHMSLTGIDRLIVVAVPQSFAERFRDKILKCRPIAYEDSFQEI
jgi:hypothetical protein